MDTLLTEAIATAVHHVGVPQHMKTYGALSLELLGNHMYKFTRIADHSLVVGHLVVVRLIS